jgi:membrane protease YdiL (CAAX protease family)
VLIVLIAVVLNAAAAGAAMRVSAAGTWMVFLAPAVPYLVLSIAAVVQMQRDGTLAAKLRPRSGDLSFGAIIALMLFFGSMAARMVLAPHGSVREAWIMRIYLQIGDPESLQSRILLVSAVVIVVSALEEVAWRGFIYGLIEDKLGSRRAWPITAVLYALASLPTVFLLGDSFAGPNPLIFLAALGCGLVWGLVVARTGRLPVAIISHALFSWCVAVQFPLWRLG